MLYYIEWGFNHFEGSTTHMTVFKSGTIDSAIEAALQELNLDRSQVDVTVLTTPRRGFLGIGARAAEIDVTPIPQTQPTATPVSKTQPVETVADAETTATAVATPVATAETQEPAPADRQAAYQQVAGELGDYLDAIVEQLGIDAQSDVTVNHRNVTVNFVTEQEGLLIGKHGRTINALQNLAQVFLNHQRFSKLVVTLDVANYRERRLETLTRLAENMAREVVATGKPVYLDPMPSFERKQIHSVLADNDHVVTYSAGAEPKRAVVITPR
jgi:spoIIIJ-associated protein